MVIWKETIISKYKYAILLLGISLVFIYGEEVQNPNESSQICTSTRFSLEKKQEKLLVESDLKFPSLSSLFSWMGSFNHLYLSYDHFFKMTATSIPQKDEYKIHTITISAYSCVLQCLEMMSDLSTLYKSSISEQNSDMLIETSSLSVNNLIKECLIPCKDLLINSYIELQDILFESKETHSPILIKSSSRVMELYYNIWEILTVLLGYINMIQQSYNILLQNRSELQENLKVLRSKKDKSPIEMLESNIQERRLLDLNRKEALINMSLSLLEGDYSLSIQIEEMESLIMTENKKSISELEESIKITEKSMKSEEKEKEGSAMQLLSALRREINLRSEALTRQTTGSPIYVQKYDSDLEYLLEKLTLEDSQSGSNNEQSKPDEKTS